MIKHGQADRTNVKYLCKLYEGQAHLESEALLFDWAETKIEKAEALYEKHTVVFNFIDKFKFLVKKSSFQKKFGFFDEALEILIDIEKQIMTMLQATQTPKTVLGCKKILFKVYRDQARLFALKRDETKASDTHRRAERILKEDLAVHSNSSNNLNQSMRLESSIKIAKLQFIKGIWSQKFSWDKSIEDIMEAYRLFGEAVGDEKNYYGANCLMEIGRNYLRKMDIDSSTQYLNDCLKIYEKLFGDAHPIL